MLVRDSRASQLQSCRQRIALFKGLQVDNYEERVLALEKIIQVVKSFVRSSLSPSSNTTSPCLSDLPEHILQLCDQDGEEYSEQLLYYLLTILRLSYTCPYSDVRQTFQDLLSGLKVSGYYKSVYVMGHLCRYIYRKQQALSYQNLDINHLLILFHCTIFSLLNQTPHHHPIMLFTLALQIYLSHHGLSIPVKMNNNLYIHNNPTTAAQIYQKLCKTTPVEGLQMNMCDR